MKEAHLSSVEFYNSSEAYLNVLERRNESEYSTILDVIQSYVVSGSVLEYGCGVGLLSMLLAQRGYTVTAVHVSEQFIRAAKEKFGASSRITFEVVAAPPLRFADNSFDVIATSSVLEHCTAVDAILLEFQRLLKSNGLLVIETPNLLSPLSRLKLIVDRLVGRRKTFHRYGTPKFLLLSMFYLMKKIVVRKPEFIYVEPDYSTFSEADEDVLYLSNHLDYLYFLRAHGFNVLQLSRNKGAVRKLISNYLPFIAGGVMVAARKKEETERHEIFV